MPGQQILVWISEAADTALGPTTGPQGMGPGEQPKGVDRVSLIATVSPEGLGMVTSISHILGPLFPSVL